MNHTPEPWSLVEVACVYANDELVADCRHWIRTNGDSTNARRIVACVNACAGIPTDTLETCIDDIKKILIKVVYMNRATKEDFPGRRDYSMYECPYAHLEKECGHELHSPEGYCDDDGRPATSVWCACGFRGPVFYFDPKDLRLQLKDETIQLKGRARA